MLELDSLLSRLRASYGDPVIERWLKSAEIAALKRLEKKKNPPKRSITARANALLRSMSPEEISKIRIYTLKGGPL